MGQTYTVTANLSFPGGDPTAFCSSVRSCIERYTRSKLARFDADGLDLSTPCGCFKALTCRSAYSAGGELVADFDGSYGWEAVMLSIFTAAASHLADGSEIIIEPDDSSHVLSVRDGKVHHSYREW